MNRSESEKKKKVDHYLTVVKKETREDDAWTSFLLPIFQPLSNNHSHKMRLGWSMKATT